MACLGLLKHALSFTPSSSGTYFIEAKSDGSYPGTYLHNADINVRGHYSLLMHSTPATLPAAQDILSSNDMDVLLGGSAGTASSSMSAPTESAAQRMTQLLDITPIV